MIHKTTDDRINELRETIKREERLRQELLNNNNPREALLTGIQISHLKEELESSYTESTPLWEVQGLIEKKIDTIHDKALAIQRELCRIYKEEECLHIKCYGCPLCIIDSNGNGDECFEALKQHLICQYLTTKFHV